MDLHRHHQAAQHAISSHIRNVTHFIYEIVLETLAWGKDSAGDRYIFSKTGLIVVT